MIQTLHPSKMKGCFGFTFAVPSPVSVAVLATTQGPLTRAGLFLLEVDRVPSCPFPPSPNESIFPDDGVKASVCCLDRTAI